MSVTLYCAWSDVEKRIGAEGADLRLDDDGGSPATFKTDILETAATEVNFYLQLLYPVEQLARSNWVKFATRDIAVFLLCLRRNHPAPQGVQWARDNAIALLEKIQAGTAQVPDIGKTKADVPVLSNQRVNLSPFPRVQTVPGKSTGTPAGYDQASDDRDQFDYGS